MKHFITECPGAGFVSILNPGKLKRGDSMVHIQWYTAGQRQC